MRQSNWMWVTCLGGLSACNASSIGADAGIDAGADGGGGWQRCTEADLRVPGVQSRRMALPLRRDRDSVFGSMFRTRYGEDVDLSDLKPVQYTAERLSHARSVWSERVQTEMRSAQIMGRFVSEVMAAGDPLDVYAGAVDMLDDEIRHVASTSALLRALGGTPLLPSPVEQRESEAFLARPGSRRRSRCSRSPSPSRTTTSRISRAGARTRQWRA